MSEGVGSRSNRMKILFVSSFFPLSTNDPIPQFLLEQVRSLACYYPKAEITVLAASRNRVQDKKIADNVTVKRFSYFWPKEKQNLTTIGILPAIKKSKWNLFQLPLLFLFEFLAILKEVKRVKPDFIYSHWFLPQGLLCSWVARRYGIHHVFTSHSYDVEICKRIPVIGSMLVRSAFSSMKAATVVSQRTLKGISTFYTKSEWELVSEKFKVIPMGVTLPSFKSDSPIESTKARMGLQDKKIIFFMGRFVEKKGIDVLLKSLLKLRKVDSSVMLVLAGDGVLKNEIEDLIHTLGLEESVHLPGFITTQEKEDYLRAADIYVLPSIESADGDREGLPVSLLESMSYGKVCVATNESGAEEVLESGINGYLCASGDVDLLHENIERALNLNDKTRKGLQNNAFETARKYAWPSIITMQSEHFFN